MLSSATFSKNNSSNNNTRGFFLKKNNILSSFFFYSFFFVIVVIVITTTMGYSPTIYVKKKKFKPIGRWWYIDIANPEDQPVHLNTRLSEVLNEISF